MRLTLVDGLAHALQLVMGLVGMFTLQGPHNSLYQY